MKEKLQSLVSNFFKLHQRPEPKGLTNYLNLYLEPSTDLKINANDVLNITRQCGLKINIGEFDDTQLKLIYVLCKLRTIRRDRPKIGGVETVPLKKIALGLEEAEKFTESVKQREILQYLFQTSQLYLKFKTISDGSSMAHLHFLKVAKDEVKKYEMAIFGLKEVDDLNFIVQTRPFLKKFLLLDQIHNHFLETRNPFSFLRIYHRNFFKQEDSLLYRIVSNCTAQLNKNINQWLRKGQFTDYGKEFFITESDQSFWISFNIEKEMVPFFLSETTIKKILYIGKASNLLGRVQKHSKSKNENTSQLDGILLDLNSLPDLDVLDPKFDVLIHERLKLLDYYVKNIFISGCQVIEHLKFCKQSFFFGRNDFIEHLFFHMKEVTKSKLSRRSYSFILDTAIQSSFGKDNPFSAALDMCILKDDDFSLFYRLSFPVNVIIEKDVIMIFLSIFKFLWKVKRIEHFLRRLKDRKDNSIENMVIITKWYCFIQKMFFYFSYEVIECEFQTLLSALDKQIFVIDELRQSIKKFLKSVILKIFQENNKGKEQSDAFLSLLEQECVNFRKHGSKFNDLHIKQQLKVLFECLPFSLENTSLSNHFIF